MPASRPEAETSSEIDNGPHMGHYPRRRPHVVEESMESLGDFLPLFYNCVILQKQGVYEAPTRPG